MSQADDQTRARREALNALLARALRGLLARPALLPPDATIEMRIRYLETEVNEVRSRVNGLFFAVLSSVALEVVGRVAL